MVEALIPHTAIKHIIVSSTCPFGAALLKVVKVAQATPLAAMTVGMFIVLYRMTRLQT